MRKNIFLQLILCLIISSCTKNDSDVKTEYFQEGLTWLPENPDADSELTINFKASTKSKLYGYTGDVYVHIGIVSENVWTFVPAEWNENIAKCKMTKKDNNCWSISLSPSIREWFASGETAINKLGIVIRSSDGYILGDFNNWTLANDGTSQMYRDNSAGCWWITVENLDPAKEYRFQYYTGTKDGDVIRLADAYSEKILDPDNDKYIPESTYPSSEMVYPEKGIGIVSTFKINKDEYSWQNNDFKINDRDNLLIYELHLRDFTSTSDLNGAMSKLHPILMAQ